MQKSNKNKKTKSSTIRTQHLTDKSPNHNSFLLIHNLTQLFKINNGTFINKYLFFFCILLIKTETGARRNT